MTNIDYGAVEINGLTINLTEQAYVSNYGTDGGVRYYAHGTDAEGNDYRVAWDLTPEREEQDRRHRSERHGDTYDGSPCDCNDDESTACDWDSPVAAERE